MNLLLMIKIQLFTYTPSYTNYDNKLNFLNKIIEIIKHIVEIYINNITMLFQILH